MAALSSSTSTVFRRGAGGAASPVATVAAVPANGGLRRSRAGSMRDLARAVVGGVSFTCCAVFCTSQYTARVDSWMAVLRIRGCGATRASQSFSPPTTSGTRSARQFSIFAHCGVVDEILVVNNNAAAGTSEEVAGRAGPDLREIHEPRQGYGNAIRRGLREATGDPDRLRAGRHVSRPRHLQAAGLRRRLRRGLRQPHRADVHLARGQHGPLPALGQLGRRQADGVPVQLHQPDRRRLHHAADRPRRARRDRAASSRSAAARSAPR